VRAFLGRQPHFTALPPEQVADVLGERAAAFREAVQRSPQGLLMTPRRMQTDGFFVALLAKQCD
jgi:16S rRNA (cytosine967-C5)-methyltransferase